MRSLTATTVLCACLVSAAPSGSASAPGQQSVFRSGVDLVSIDTSVRRRNAVVTGLTAADFELLDNGVRQQVELDPVATVPVDVTVVLEQSGELRLFRWQDLKSDLTKIARQLRPVDRIRVIAVATSVRQLVSMRPAEQLREQDLAELTPGEAISQEREDPELNGVSMFDALFLALARPEEVGRRHLVAAFGSGADASSVLDYDAIEAVARRSDAVLHVVLLPARRTTSRLGTFLLYDRSARPVLTAAALVTGGEAHNLNDGVGAFKSIFADFTRGYVLRYTLTGVPAAGWHRVVVTTPRHPEYTIHARAGYFGR
jgi:VWFA-related protein